MFASSQPFSQRPQTVSYSQNPPASFLPVPSSLPRPPLAHPDGGFSVDFQRNVTSTLSALTARVTELTDGARTRDLAAQDLASAVAASEATLTHALAEVGTRVDGAVDLFEALAARLDHLALAVAGAGEAAGAAGGVAATVQDVLASLGDVRGVLGILLGSNQAEAAAEVVLAQIRAAAEAAEARTQGLAGQVAQMAQAQAAQMEVLQGIVATQNAMMDRLQTMNDSINTLNGKLDKVAADATHANDELCDRLNASFAHLHDLMAHPPAPAPAPAPVPTLVPAPASPLPLPLPPHHQHQHQPPLVPLPLSSSRARVLEAATPATPFCVDVMRRATTMDLFGDN